MIVEKVVQSKYSKIEASIKAKELSATINKMIADYEKEYLVDCIVDRLKCNVISLGLIVNWDIVRD